MGCSAVGSVISSGINAYSAGQAANTEKSAAEYAANLQLQEQDQVRSDLRPYNVAGQAADTQLSNDLSGQNPTGELQQLQATPGYNFALNQGLESTQNGEAAKGEGISGAALKAAGQYSTGLAEQTYQTNLLNPLISLMQTGESAAAQTGSLGTAGVANAGAGIVGAGNAAAAGIVGSGNAISSGIGSASNAPLNYALYSNLASGGGGSGNNVGAETGAWD
jgi:hypothetical protein